MSTTRYTPRPTTHDTTLSIMDAVNMEMLRVEKLKGISILSSRIITARETCLEEKCRTMKRED